MYNKYDFHNLMQSFFQSQVQSAQEFSKYKDQLSDSMLSLAHRHIDTSIQSLEKFHEHVSSDASTLKSDILAATLKTAIDHHNHFKNHLRLHKDSSNSRNQTFRRLAIGTSMAVFGLMSGVKASTLQNTDGQLTPRSTAHAWIAEKASGKTPLKSPSTVHQSLYSAANTAKTAGDPERVLELWRTQQAFTQESNREPYRSDEIIGPSTVHQSLYSASKTAQTEGNPERVLELWRTQQAFTQESNREPYRSDEIIGPSTVHQSLKDAANTAKTAGNPERVLELWRTQQAFAQESTILNMSTVIPASTVHQSFDSALHKETNSTRIVSLHDSWSEFETTNKISDYSQKRPADFKAKYDAAKKEVEAARSLVPAQGLEEATTANTLSVAFLIAEHGRSNIDTSSLTNLQTSFNTYYKTAVLRLHPDKNPSDAEKFKTLGSHKAWIDSLTPETFAASAK
jgi:hypothetical protein